MQVARPVPCPLNKSRVTRMGRLSRNTRGGARRDLVLVDAVDLRLTSHGARWALKHRSQNIRLWLHVSLYASGV